MSNRWNNTFSWAVQYYVSGRYAVGAGLIPIAGSLLHHAIEMALKAGLEKAGESVPKIHSLTRLWAIFQTKFDVASNFDATVRDLDEFEDIRYPDQIKKTLLMTIGYKREAGQEATHSLALDEVDALFQAISRTAGINLQAFAPLKSEAKKYYP